MSSTLRLRCFRNYLPFTSWKYWRRIRRLLQLINCCRLYQLNVIIRGQILFITIENLLTSFWKAWVCKNSTFTEQFLLSADYSCPKVPSSCIKVALRLELSAGGTCTNRFKFQENVDFCQHIRQLIQLLSLVSIYDHEQSLDRLWPFKKCWR